MALPMGLRQSLLSRLTQMPIRGAQQDITRDPWDQKSADLIHGARDFRSRARASGTGTSGIAHSSPLPASTETAGGRQAQSRQPPQPLAAISANPGTSYSGFARNEMPRADQNLQQSTSGPRRHVSTRPPGRLG